VMKSNAFPDLGNLLFVSMGTVLAEFLRAVK
jgi:hypothetical protein